MKEKSKRPLICAYCGKVFYDEKGVMPILVIEGRLCGNECLTKHFREKIADAENPFAERP